MNITRRPAREEDTDTARSMHHQAYRDVVERQFGTWDEAAQDDYFQRGWRDAAYEMVLCDGVPCGYLCVEDRDTNVHVRDFVIAPQFQGRGIGTSLLREVIERARSRGVPARLATFHENHALNLYLRLGFHEFGRTNTHIWLEWQPGNVRA